MIGYSVVRSTYAQTYNDAGKEERKSYGIGPCHRMRFECVKRQGDEEKNPRAGKVRVDIDGFVV